MKINFISKGEKKELSNKLKKQYGIENLKKFPFLLFKDRNDEIRGFSGNLNKRDIKILNEELNIRKIGIPLFEEIKNSIKLNSYALGILKPKKNLIELNDEESEEWFKKRKIKAKNKNLKGYVVLKNNKDYLRSGKLSQGEIEWK